jgi:hypothetical protein
MDKDEVLNTLAKVFHNGEEMEGDDGAALVVEMLKPRDEEIEELKRQKDALMEELENIATAEWREFDPDTRRCAYEFVLWAQSRARHTLNRVLSGDVTAPLPEDVAIGCAKGWREFNDEPDPALRHNVRSQATDADLSRQVACTDGLCPGSTERTRT